MSVLRLNLGSGPDYRPGWVNCDADPAVKAEFHADIADWPAFMRASIEWATGAHRAHEPVAEIYLKHVLEHLPIAAIPATLRNFHQLLAPGGTLTIDGPNLRTMCAYLAQKAEWTWDDVAMVYGGQLTVHDRHLAGWSPEFLGKLLVEAGFASVSWIPADLCFVMRGVKVVVTPL